MNNNHIKNIPIFFVLIVFLSLSFLLNLVCARDDPMESPAYREAKALTDPPIHFGASAYAGETSPEDLERCNDILNLMTREDTRKRIAGHQDRFVLLKSFKDGMNHSHFVFQQYYRDTEYQVIDGQIGLHLRSEDPNDFFVNDGSVDIGDIDLNKQITGEEAIFIARSNYPCEICNRSEIIMYDYIHGIFIFDNETHFGYDFFLKIGFTSRRYQISAISGEILSDTDANKYVSATIPTYYNGNFVVEAHYDSVHSRYVMEDWDYYQHGTVMWGSPNTLNTNTSHTSTTFTALHKRAGQVFVGVTKALSYYYWVHGRNGMDGSWGAQTLQSSESSLKYLSQSIVDYYDSNGNPAPGAYWTDGDFVLFGSLYGEPISSFDIIGHEVTHGVINKDISGRLNPQGHALNEGISDAMGVMIRRYVFGNHPDMWCFGFEFFDALDDDDDDAGDCYRNMKNPAAVGYPSTITGMDFSGSVHRNGAPFGRWFQLLCEGGYHPNAGSTYLYGIGFAYAEQILYRAISTYTTVQLTYEGLRVATWRAAFDLYPTNTTMRYRMQMLWYFIGVSTAPWDHFVINPSFEFGNSSWTGTTGVTNYTSAYTHTGYYSASLFTSSQFFQQRMYIPYTYGTYLHLEFFYKTFTSTNWNNEYFYVYIYDSGNNLVDTSTVTNTVASGSNWQYFYKSLPNGLQTQNCTVKFLTTTLGGSTVFHIDDVAIYTA